MPHTRNKKLTQDFSENENQNHSNVESGLLSCSTDTSVTNDTNGKTARSTVSFNHIGKQPLREINLPSCHTSQTDRETSTELDKPCVQGNLLVQVVCDQDRNDQPIDTNDTSHDNGNNVYKQSVSKTKTTPRPEARQPIKLLDYDNILLTIRSGLKTAIPQTPTPALAVP